MEANDFILRLKADGTERDLVDLQKAYIDFKVILEGLGVRNKGSFALNVLCTLCRNIDKVPSWRSNIDAKILTTLSIDCVRETRVLAEADQVKTLACIYHIHKHVIRLPVSSVPPELILKLSYMPFESNTKPLLEKYSKTYWNIVVDRTSYFEKLKGKMSITKLLTRLTDDILRVIEVYETVPFCINVLQFLIKKLHYMFNESSPKELQKSFAEIFKKIASKKDLAAFKKLSEKELIDVYVKFMDCFYVIAENSSKVAFENCTLNIVVRTAITLIGHDITIMRCLEAFFVNGFCSIFENFNNTTNTENILKNILSVMVDMEKNGKENILVASYPFLGQFLRLYIDITMVQMKKNTDVLFTEDTQLHCMNLMLFLSSKKYEQYLKCDNCRIKTGLHDSLRLLFLIKYFPEISIAQNVNMDNILPTYYKLVLGQQRILAELKRLGCINYEKCFRKLQTDIHNASITLNKANYYEYSIKLFDIYIEVEMRQYSERKNICRAFYNKSICELDSKLYVDALKDAYLSLIFSMPDGLKSEKYMSLVMDVKAKSLKANEDDPDQIQAMSVLDACKLCFQEMKYSNLKPFLVDLKFSDLLLHEFTLYTNLWPSIVPIGAVWKSLRDLVTEEQPSWLKAENKDDLLWCLYKIILKTPTVVRTIYSDIYSTIITEILDTFNDNQPKTTESQFVYAALLFFKCEYDLNDAAIKYGWKVNERSTDPDQFQAIRTIPQEHEASRRAMEAVKVTTRAVANIQTIPKSTWLHDALQMYQVFVVQLLHLNRTVPALQLAYNCCHVARHLGDSESYVWNASILLFHAQTACPQMMGIIEYCSSIWKSLSTGTALCFLCNSAIYYNKCGSSGTSARLIQIAQARILEAHKSQPDVNLDLAVGRLLVAQAQICTKSVSMSTLSGIQRHYLAISNTETKWSHRRRLALTLKHHIAWSHIRAGRLCRSLMLWRRARCATLQGLPASGAVDQAYLFLAITNVHKTDDAQTKIDNRLKHILGLQPSNEIQNQITECSKPELFTPRHENIETMLENMVLKTAKVSPSLPCTSVYAYKMPEFFKHDKICPCYCCNDPNSFIIACYTSGLEASTYFRAKEFDIARNYFEGTLKSFGYAESKMKAFFLKIKDVYDSFVIDMVEKVINEKFKEVEIEVLIEAAFFELTLGMNDKADDLIVRIHEIIQEINELDPYLRNDVTNLMIASARLRKATVKHVETGLESELEALKLSPTHNVDPPKTPDAKAIAPPKLPRNIVKPEDLPAVKRKVIKLNLDENVDEEISVRPRRKPQFKIPVPVTSKPVLEVVTPCTRKKPDIVVSKPDTALNTPNDKNEFFTPISTQKEEFFTPMTSVKTYSKKGLRANIVKNLEAEFSTPNGKENATEQLEVPKTRASRSKVDKTGLKRATSPGKLVKEKPSRLRKPVSFKVLEDK